MSAVNEKTSTVAPPAKAEEQAKTCTVTVGFGNSTVSFSGVPVATTVWTAVHRAWGSKISLEEQLREIYLPQDGLEYESIMLSANFVEYWMAQAEVYCGGKEIDMTLEKPLSSFQSQDGKVELQTAMTKHSMVAIYQEFKNQTIGEFRDKDQRVTRNIVWKGVRRIEYLPSWKATATGDWKHLSKVTYPWG